MAEPFIEEIYQEAMILYRMKRAVREGNKGIAVSSFEQWSKGGDLILKALPFIREEDPQMADAIWNMAQYCREAHADVLLFISRIEHDLIPLLMQRLNRYTGIDVAEDGWNLKSSSTAFLTLRDQKRDRFLHSPFDPMWEAYELVSDVYAPEKHTYHILGCGLGYFPFLLWEESDESLEIYLYENDAQVLNYAHQYGVLDWIAPDHLHIITEDNPDELAELFLRSRIDHPKDGSFISPWKSGDLSVEYNQELLDEYTNDLGRRLYSQLWDINLTNNRRKTGTHSMTELYSADHREEWVVVAAGPSVDENMDFLRESVGKRMIIAVSTVLRKLVRAGIYPDYLTVLDPTAEVADHLDGVEEKTKEIPLLAEPLTNWHFIDRYQGEIYYVVSNNSAPYVTDMLEEGAEPWVVEGTVTSLAVTACIQLGAQKVYLLGVDLGYPGNKNYADGSAHEVHTREEGTLITEAVDGGTVATNETFQYFRSSVEHTILAFPKVRFYNRSAHGAYIHGTMMDAWWEKTDSLDTVEDKRNYLKKLFSEPFLTWRRQYYLLWQLIDGMTGQEYKMLSTDLDDAYFKIYQAFRTEMNWQPSPSGKASGLTLIFGLHYDHAMEDDFSSRFRKTALQVTLSGGKPFLVSTEEYLAGEMITLERYREKTFDMSMKDAEEIKDGNRVYPYYMFPANMPELRFIREFLNFLDKHRPSEIIKLGKYSLTADYVEECFGNGE